MNNITVESDNLNRITLVIIDRNSFNNVINNYLLSFNNDTNRDRTWYPFLNIWSRFLQNSLSLVLKV